MTLIRLRFLVNHVESAIATFQQMLETDPKNREEYQNQISQSKQHLYQLSHLINRLEKEVAHLEICLRLKPIKPKKTYEN